MWQAAIGSKALDMAREEGNETLMRFGLDVLTLAVLAILITAPIGALGIGLAGPHLLAQQVKGQSTQQRWSRSSLCTCEDTVESQRYVELTHSKIKADTTFQILQILFVIVIVKLPHIHFNFPDRLMEFFTKTLDSLLRRGRGQQSEWSRKRCDS